MCVFWHNVLRLKKVIYKELKDIRKIRIDRNHTKEKRIAQYLRQVGNPYLVCIGNVKVKIRFANNGVSFEDAFEELLLSV